MRPPLHTTLAATLAASLLALLATAATPAAAPAEPQPATPTPAPAPAPAEPLPATAAAPATPPAAPPPAAAAPAEPLLWLSDLEQAISSADASLRPVFVFFTAPGCGWCTRLKQTSLQDGEVQQLLRQYVTAQIDVLEQPRVAAEYNVAGVPLVMILGSRGTVQFRVGGYQSAAELQLLLRQALNPALAAPSTPRTDEVLRLLAAGPLPDERWPDVALALGEARARDRILSALAQTRPLPIEPLAAQLENPSLAVRMGAIELLEELTGTNHGFDPWQTAEQLEANQEAIARFRSHEGSNTVGSVFLAFEPQQFEAYVLDLVSDNRARSQRAARMLRRGGVNTMKALYGYLADHPGLEIPARRTIRELQYSLYLAGHSKADGERWAHRLVAGSLDVRTQAIADLKQLGAKAPPILRDFLADPNPLIRESAVEILAQTGSAGQIIPLFSRHLAGERNREVVYRILAECRRYRTKSSLELLLQWIAHDNEDLAIAAIQSIGKLRTPDAEEPLLPGLSDPRWRVRLATLETMNALKYGKHADALAALLQDPDEFVRFKAVETLAAVSKEGGVKALREAFLADDALKPAIAAALSSLRQPMTQDLIDALRDKPPHIVAATLGALRRPSNPAIAFAVRCASHADPDVSTSALRLLASNLSHPEALKLVLQTFKEGNPERLKAVLQALDLDEDQFGGAGSGEIDFDDAASSRSVFGALVKAFVVGSGDRREAPAAAPAQPLPALRYPADAVFTDFGVPPPAEDSVAVAAGDPFAGGGRRTGRGPSATLRQVHDALVVLMQSHADATVRDLAMMHLLGAGRSEALPVLEERLPHATVDERRQYASALSDYSPEQAGRLLQRLLSDPAAQVRSSAASTLLSRSERNVEWGRIVLREVAREGAVLQPIEAYAYSFQNLNKAGETLVPDIRALLAAHQARPAQLFGLLAAGVVSHKDLLPDLEAFLKHADPVLRRAAWHAFGRTDKDAAVARVAEIAGDASELVREVVLTLADDRTGSREWRTYFDAATVRHAYLPYSYTYYGSRDRQKLPDGLATALRGLTTDPHVPLRARALFVLLSNRIAVDLNQLVATLDQIPDPKVASQLATGFVESNLETIGPRFRILLPYLKERYESSEYFAKRLAEKFPGKLFEEEGTEIADLALAPRPAGSTDAPLLAALDLTEAGPETGDAAPEDRPVTLLFFTTTGCSDCERTRRMLPDMQRLFRNLTVETLDLRDVHAMRLNEALSEQFGVPMKQRLVSPALFARAGALVRTEIRPDAVAALLARSTAVDDGTEAWYRLDETLAAQADERIVGRQETFHLLFVLLAALADGINPCAFATIVFLLSYLQVTRRTPRQIMRIGAGFIAGVFIAYFALGLGLAEIVERFSILQRLGQALTYGLAAFAVVIMVLSFRDGVLCLRGRMGDMTLQLPLMLKRQIHGAIRTGARQSRLVLAAFVTGVTVSVLELACTGQVYLPTILYILKTGRDPARIYGMLALYNLVFILPLTLVFLLACRGLTSAALHGWLERHAAAVKFATAALFLVLVVYLLFGHRFG